METRLFRTNWLKPPGWYIKLIQDSTFANELNCRTFNLRNTILDTSNLFHFIDSLENILNDAQERHFIRWPILGVNVGTPELVYSLQATPAK